MAHTGQLLDLFTPETGQRVSRFGAALGGNLAQFDVGQRQQREEQRKLSAERRLALLTDNRQVRRFLEAGDTGRATTLLQNRIQNIGQLGGDPKDTVGLLSQLENDPKGALVEVTALDNRAVDEGLLEAFPVVQPKVLSTTAEGQAIIEKTPGVVVAEKIPGFSTKRETAKDVEGVTRFVDSGLPVIPGEGKRLLKKQNDEAVKIANAAGKQNFDDAKDLRREFSKASGDFLKVRDAFDRIQRSAKDPSAAGDLALIFNYMKMLDPGSVVRESEFATAQNSAGVPDRIRALWNKTLSGQRMAPDQRADFVDRAQSLFAGQVNLQQKNVDRFTKLANRFKIDPDLVVSDLSAGITAQPGQSAVPVVSAPRGGPAVPRVMTLEEIDAIAAGNQ